MDKQTEPAHQLLVEAGILLTSSLDYQITLSNVAQLITRSIAHWCVIDLIDEHNHLQRVAVSHADPAKLAIAHELQQRYPVLEPETKHTIQRVLQGGETWFDPNVSQVRLAAEARDARHFELLKALGFTSEIVVPLIARRHTIGALTLVLGEGNRRYDESDLKLVEELARRVALAVDNARLFGEVEAQREWLQVTLSSIGDGVIATDAQAQVMFMNPVASALTGWSFDKAQGQKIETVFHIINEHSRAPVPTPIRQALEQGIKVGLATHTLLVARDGSERPISDSGAPIRDRDGRTIGAVLVFRDVSEQRAAEIALTASEARYRNLIENANDIIYTLDLAGNITSLNEAGERVLGYGPQELLNQSIEQIIEVADLEMMRGMLRRKLGGEARTRYEVNARAKDGHRIVLEINSQLIIVDGVPTGVYGIARDVTQRRRAGAYTALLQQITEAFSQAITPAEVADAVVQQALMPLNAHSGMVARLTALTELELISFYNVSTKWINYYKTMPLHADTILARAVREGMPIWIENLETFRQHYPATAANASMEGIQAVAALPLVIEGRIIGGISVGFSQTQTFDSFERSFLLAVAQQCAHALERTRLAEQAQAAAAAAERQRLARDLHDAVTQTLFSAMTIAESVERLWDRDPARARALLQQTVILNRSALSEMRALLLELRPEVIVKTSLHDLLRQLASAVQGRKHMDITLNLEEGSINLPPDVHIAVYRIAQESMNNIVKHSQASQLSIDLTMQAKQVMLRICDNGSGFDVAHQSAGLGLSTMRERAEAVGAEFHIDSSPGRGTETILLWQPAASSPPAVSK